MKFTGDKNKVSVMMLVTSFYPFAVGGSELQAFRLAKELQKKGVNVYIVSLGLKGIAEYECFDGIKVYRVYSWVNSRLLLGNKKTKNPIRTKIEYEPQNPNNFKISDKKSLFSLIAYFFVFINLWFFLRKRKEPLDYIYVPVMEWAAFVGAVLGKLFGKKVVIKDSTVNGTTNLLRYPFGKSMQRVIVKNSAFVAMTQAIKKNYTLAGIEEENIYLIPNGVDVSDIQWTQGNNENFVFVGNLYQQPAKGVDVLLKAWEMVVKQIPDARLDIIGNGNIQAYIDYVKTLGIDNNVRFLGKQTDVQKYLLESRAFVLPSRREGMSNALLEAMALGMPCIATNISGSQDLVQPFFNGILLPVEDAVALKDAIVYLYENPEKAQLMGKEARISIEKGYAFNVVAEKYFDLFTSKLVFRS